jgi:hypothetical protein
MNKQDRFEYQSIDSMLTAVLVVGLAVGGATGAIVWVVRTMLG